MTLERARGRTSFLIRPPVSLPEPKPRGWTPFTYALNNRPKLGLCWIVAATSGLCTLIGANLPFFRGIKIFLPQAIHWKVRTLNRNGLTMTPMKIQWPVNLFLGPPFYGNVSDKNVDLGRFDKYVDPLFSYTRRGSFSHPRARRLSDNDANEKVPIFWSFDHPVGPLSPANKSAPTQPNSRPTLYVDHFGLHHHRPELLQCDASFSHRYSHIDFDFRFSNCHLLIRSLGLFIPLPSNLILLFRVVVVRSSAAAFKKLLFALRCPLKFPNIPLSTLKDVNILDSRGSCLQHIEAHICAANSTWESGKCKLSSPSRWSLLNRRHL